MKIAKVAHISGLLFPQLCINFDEKQGLGYILGDFSKTHLVTLTEKKKKKRRRLLNRMTTISAS
jgi:hypothetical protein